MPDSSPHSELFANVREGIPQIIPDPGWGTEYRHPSVQVARDALASLDCLQEMCDEIVAASRDWRKSDEFIGLLVRARVPKEYPGG